MPIPAPSQPLPAAQRRWFVSHLGSREHYAVPVGLHRRGQLERMYTEAWLSRSRGLLAKLGKGPRALANRYHPEIPDGLVRSRTLLTLSEQLASAFKRKPPKLGTEHYLNYKRIGQSYSQWVARGLANEPGFDANAAVFAFNTSALETFDVARRRGALAVLDQIAPARGEDRLVQEEARAWPGWQPGLSPLPEVFFERFDAEWAASDVVLVNSPWSADSLAEQGVPRDKLIIVPLAFERSSTSTPPDRPIKRGELHVLWLGQVILRKGIQYLIEAARKVQHLPIRFTVIGPILISPDKVAQAPDNMSFLGRVTRDQTARQYLSADLFVLPTISDGFAITQLEAMAQGLPVVATPNCGRVVEDGKTGRVVPIRDPEALAAAFVEALDDPDRLAEWGRAAFERSAEFGIEAYVDTMFEQIDRVQQAAPDRGVVPC